MPESCSLKVPGCPEWVAHLDRSREGSFQVVIALTDTTFLVWPDSHLVPIGRDCSKKGFYSLSRGEKAQLDQAGCAKEGGCRGRGWGCAHHVGRPLRALLSGRAGRGIRAHRDLRALGPERRVSLRSPNLYKTLLASGLGGCLGFGARWVRGAASRSNTC